MDWYDYGFRSYDAQIGRFTQLDPLTDDYPYYTPYQFAGNEPVANVDMDGLEPVSTIGLANKLGNQGINTSVKLIEKGANAGKWAVSWVSAAGIGNSVMFATKTVGMAGKAGMIAGTIIKTMQVITTTTHQNCHRPAPADLNKGNNNGWKLPQLFVMGSGSESFGSDPDPNQPIYSFNYKEFMDKLDYSASGFNAANQRESLQKIGREKFVSLWKKWGDAIMKQMENKKNGNTGSEGYTESTENTNDIDPVFNKKDAVIYDRRTGIKTKNRVLSDEKATDTFPAKKVSPDYIYPMN